MGQPLLQQGFSFSSVDYSSTYIKFHPLESIPEGVTINFREPTSPPSDVKQNHKNHIRFCQALYDFEASSSSELNFKKLPAINNFPNISIFWVCTATKRKIENN